MWLFPFLIDLPRGPAACADFCRLQLNLDAMFSMPDTLVVFRPKTQPRNNRRLEIFWRQNTPSSWNSALGLGSLVSAEDILDAKSAASILSRQPEFSWWYPADFAVLAFGSGGTF